MSTSHDLARRLQLTACVLALSALACAGTKSGEPTGGTAGRGFSLSNTGAPNDVLIYRIIYTNPTTKPSTNLVVNDATPPFTVHAAPATCPAAQTPAGLGTCTITQPGAIGQTGSYRYPFALRLVS